MRTELSAIDLRYLIKELQQIINAKVDQVYQDGNECSFRLHMTGTGKTYLRCVLPSFIFLSQNKGEHGEKPGPFCSLLRKYLPNARIQSIVQLGSERALCILFSTSESDYRLYIELFSKGNIVLADNDGKIIGVLHL